MSEAKFLNVDLDVESSASLDPLIQEWGERVFVVHHTRLGGSETASFECEEPGEDPAEIVNRFCELVESLSPAGRAAWDACGRRTLNFGFEGGDIRCEVTIGDAATVRRLAELVIALEITIYPQEQR
jgi:hypothetical protein